VPERITETDAAYVARLARLDLTEEELALYTEQLRDVLEYAHVLAALETSGVEPTAHPQPLTNVFRADEPRPSLERDEVLAMAPDTEAGRFRVPRILGEAP
jgi:aspartyl-tRNA(Asn)/glutamyl-tRNA(Gln) amidotransferase subunit C